jgi:sugar phosphate permease
MAMVLYLDRVCISQALVPMKEEFGWSNTQTSLVLMAFTLSYGIFEIPTGRMGDVFGSRGVLTRIVCWWSAFTILTGCVSDFTIVLDGRWFPIVFNTLTLLVMIRFWFGAGEAGALPNAARIIKHWFPESERGRIQGVFQASMHIGGATAPMLAATIIDSSLGWRATFYIFGAIGAVWALAFFWWFRDNPHDHPAVNQAEAELIGARPPTGEPQHHAVPWGQALTHPSVYLLSIIIILSAFNTYFFFSWYPTYLREAREVSNATAGRIASFALFGATLGSLTGGYVTDRITRTARNRYAARRLFCLVAYGVAAMCLYQSVVVDAPWVSGTFCALACFGLFCQLPTWWACAYDLAGKHTGAMFGLLNGVGVVGAMGSQFFFGWFADWRKGQGHVGRDQWDPAFYVSVAMLVVAGILWQFMWPRRVIGEQDNPTAIAAGPPP